MRTLAIGFLGCVVFVAIGVQYCCFCWEIDANKLVLSSALRVRLKVALHVEVQQQAEVVSASGRVCVAL